MYTIRKIKPSEVEEALALAWEVFEQFEVPDYHVSGKVRGRGVSALCSL